MRQDNKLMLEVLEALKNALALLKTYENGAWEPVAKEVESVSIKVRQAVTMDSAAPELLASVEGFFKLLDDEVLQRNISGDHDFKRYMDQSARLVSHLQASKSAVAKARGEA